jgi:hypothetical protein
MREECTAYIINGEVVAKWEQSAHCPERDKQGKCGDGERERAMSRNSQVLASLEVVVKSLALDDGLWGVWALSMAMQRSRYLAD